MLAFLEMAACAAHSIKRGLMEKKLNLVRGIALLASMESYIGRTAEFVLRNQLS